MIAAIASGAAAVIVSEFWTKGTIIASAMTPVIVALVSEGLRKPVESDLVRKPLRVARSAVTSNVPVTFDRRPSAEHPDQGAAASDVRIYSSGSNRARTKPRRNLHVKVAVITGLVAFLIAAAFLTLPEVIFGGSVAGGHRTTTYFGGSTKKSSSSSSSEDKTSSKDSTDSSSSSSDNSKDSTDQSSSSNDQTTTDQTTTTAPDQTTTNQTTTQQTAPQTTAPTTTTPTAPTTPTPTTPTP